MLTIDPTPPLSDFDQLVFETVVPADHYLRQVIDRVDFERFRARLAEAYSPNWGRPPIDPVRMLKILFLRFHYKLSDRQVIERARTDMAFRWFLAVPLQPRLPNHTDCTNFRKRIGVEGFAEIFQELIAQAREAGLVKDRLRLKDATHLLADVADLRPLQLVAQVRERLLQAALPLWPEWVGEQRLHMETLRQTTAELDDEERLAARVEHLHHLATQLHERLADVPAGDVPAGDVPAGVPAKTKAQQRLRRVLAIVDKLLADRQDPNAQDRLVSDVDPDARVGLHGGYFVGYLLDVSMDPDSELITSLNVLPANGAEAADAITLIRQEEAAQGNDIEGLSMDGAGCNGPVLRELTDPAGLNVDVIVPPPQPAPRTTFGPERFALTVIDEQHGEVTCPAGQTTRQRSRTRQGTGYRYQFKTSQCAGCPLRGDCLANPASKRGRVVIKNDYEAEYKRVQAKAQTTQYQETRRIHPKVERKLGEVVRHHGARRACYRGLAKVLMQALLTALVVNMKRMTKLLRSKLLQPTRSAGTVRAEVVWT
jgi:transposase